MFPLNVEAPPWTFFDERGEILLNATMDHNSARVTLELSDVFHEYVPGIFDPATTYMVEMSPGEWAAKSRPEPTAVIEGTVLRGVPEGAEILINSKSYIAEGGDISLTFKQLGEKQITVLAFPQKTLRVTYAND